jgi:hypothetical protein
MKTDMKVVSINGRDEFEAKRKKDMLEVLDSMREMIENDEIKEFVAASVDEEGIPQIHVCAMDLPGSVGLFEMGKHILIAQEC